METKLIKGIIVGVSVLVAVSCTKNFTEINTNPNNPDFAPITNVFAGTITNIGSAFGTSEIAFPASFVGFASRSIYNDATNYNGTPPASFWSSLMSSFSRNINVVIKDSEENGNSNTLAAALVVKAYGTLLLVDAYGPVPYFEAGLGSEGNFKPKYDNEQVILEDLIVQLDRANGLFDNAAVEKIGVGDILLGNDMDLWKKFGNSLQLRIAIRISNIDAATSGDIITKILGDPANHPILQSNADNIMLAYPGGGDWREPWTSASDSYVDIKVGAPIIDILTTLDDPRLSEYAEANDDGVFKGLVIGADGDDTYSMIHSQFVDNETGSVPFLKYSEVEFIRAEAYARGLVTGDAEAAYNKAITASLSEYGIAQTDIDDYLAQANVSWNDDLTRLYTQKWIALFRESWEAWAEMRRTDVPALDPAVNSNYSGHNRTPFRFSYPDSERSLNGSNIPTSVNEADNYWGYQIWWDTRSSVQ